MKRLMIFFCWVAICGCQKEEVKFSNIPKIRFDRFSPNEVRADIDSLGIWLEYEDGDGDLGENRNDVFNCFVKDLRAGIVYRFRIPQLAPTDARVPITGSVQVVFQSVPMMSVGSASESVQYEIFVTDRAGQESNRITTPSLSVRR